MSLLLQRLEAELLSTTDRQHWGKLLCKKAAYLARVGRFAESKDLVSELRQQFASARSGPVTPWIMLIEGLIHYFETLDAQALDRVSRALILAIPIQDKELTATAAAWKAHIEFERSQFAAMGKSLLICRENSSTDNHSALSRMSMVICDALLLCGEKSIGQRWFLRSRDHALQEGDQASVEAIVYNRAAFNLAWLRAQKCLGISIADSLLILRLEVASARNLLSLTGIAALTHTVAICEARLLILEERFVDASHALDELRVSAPRIDYNFSDPLLELELTFSRIKGGQLNEPTDNVTDSWLRRFDSLDADDRLAAAWMTREITKSAGSRGAVSLADDYYSRSRDKYLETLTAIKLAVEPFCSDQTFGA